jgi:hypothetical protein
MQVTLPDQRRIGEQFMDALGVLDRLPTAARLSINIPYELVTIGADWEAYRLALAHWFLNVAPTLSDGRYDLELPNTPLYQRTIEGAGEVVGFRRPLRLHRGPSMESRRRTPC